MTRCHCSIFQYLEVAQVCSELFTTASPIPRITSKHLSACCILQKNFTMKTSTFFAVSLLSLSSTVLSAPTPQLSSILGSITNPSAGNNNIFEGNGAGNGNGNGNG